MSSSTTTLGVTLQPNRLSVTESPLQVGNATNGSSAYGAISASCILRDAKNNPVVNLSIPASTFSLCVVGNLMAIVYLWRSNRKCQQQRAIPFYTLLLSLTWADLLGCLVTSPITFVAYVSGNCVVELGGPGLCEFSGLAMIFIATSSMAIVFAMSLERFIAIRYTLFYKSRITNRKILSFLVSLLAFLLLVSILPLIGFGEISQQIPGSWCFLNWRSLYLRHQIFNFLVVSVGISLMLGTIICNVFAIVHLTHSHRNRRRKITKKEIEMMILMGVMTLVFVVCNLPLMLRILVNQILSIRSDEFATSSLSTWDLFAVRMASVNPIVDPWVYILFRRSVLCKASDMAKRMVTCHRQDDSVRGGFLKTKDKERHRSPAKMQTTESVL